jgi:serine/threonine-protein kinase
VTDAFERLKSALADRYSIERELGAGGMATVYLAEDLKHERQVAVKVLRPELAAALGPERFQREIKLTAQLQHPHILPLHDSGEADGFLYYVMPYVEGETLRDRLNREKQLPLDDALQITREVADALDSAHRHGVVHRDIKPENILIDEGHAVVADFGIARAVHAAGGEQLTETGISLGTPHYMSPEQAAGERDLDGRSDIYSLGCVLYEMLTGQPPFMGPTVENIVHQLITVEPRPVTELRPAVPAPVARALGRALAKTPADRFADAAQVVAALSDTAPLAESPRAIPWRAMVAGAVIVAVVGTSSWLLGGADAGEAVPPVGNRSWVIVSEFDGTVDEVTRSVARRHVSGVIDQSGTFLTVPPSQLEVGLGLAMKPDTTRIDPDVARELAERGGFSTVVTGTLDRIGEVHTVTLRALDPTDGATVATATGRTDSEDGLIDTFTEVGTALVEDLERSSDVVPPTRREVQAMTPSLDAFRLFVEANRIYTEEGDYRGAVELLEEALAIDSAFAWAWRLLGNAYQNVRPDSMAFVVGRARRFQDRLTEAQRLAVDGDYAEFVDTAAAWRDRLARALRLYDRAVQVNPGDPTLHRSRARLLTLAGQHEEGLTALHGADSVLPFGLPPWLRGNRAAWGYVALGRYGEAWAEIPHLPGLVAEGMIQVVLLGEKKWDEALDSAKTHLDNPTVPRFRQQRAARVAVGALAARGRLGEARAMVDAYDLSWGEGLKIALATNPGSGIDPIEFPDSLPWNFGTPENARTDLRSMLQDQRWREVLTAIGSIIVGRASQHHDWLRAEAYLRLDRPDSAVAAFERVLDPTRRDWDNHQTHGLFFPYAHRRLALLYEELGEIDRAEDGWLVFLETVTDPDPELQWMVHEARQRLEELALGR